MSVNGKAKTPAITALMRTLLTTRGSYCNISVLLICGSMQYNRKMISSDARHR